MGRSRTGSVLQLNDKSWWARITYKDELGKRRERRKRATNKSNARELVKELIRELEDHGVKSVNASTMSFGQLADYYETTYLMHAEYVDGRKVAGARTAYDLRLKLRSLRNHFSARPLRSITLGEIERFRSIRLKTPTKHGHQRAIASVNRELALLRRVMNVAQAEGWLPKTPFRRGSKVISVGDERRRERILSRQEEDSLLAQCVGPRKHLRPIIICALDTGMRQGEILKLRWPDVDLDSETIIVKAFNTKTMTERILAMTPRLKSELAKLRSRSVEKHDTLIFGIEDNVKRSFATVRKLAGLEDVRFHDLRHTAATRLVQRHIPLSEVGRILGHTQANTTYRYVNANQETARRAADALASFSDVENESQSATVH